MLLLSLKSTAFLVDDDPLPEKVFASARFFDLGFILDVFRTDKEAWRCTQVVSIVSLSGWIMVDE
jgi:hypothetical protein